MLQPAGRFISTDIFSSDLNISFLEMRLSEKNYFLYRDETALAEIEKKINSICQRIEKHGTVEVRKEAR